MTAILPKDTDMHTELFPLQAIADSDYRKAVEEFDHLWETETTEDKRHRMVELLRLIEAYEGVNSSRGR